MAVTSSPRRSPARARPARAGQPDVGMPGREQVARRLDEPRAAGAARAKLGGAQVRVRSGPEAAAPAPTRRPPRARRRPSVRPRARRRRAASALRIVLGQGAGDRPVRGAAGDGGGAVVGGGAQQRVAERDLARGERDDPALSALSSPTLRSRRRPARRARRRRGGPGGGDHEQRRRVSSPSPSSGARARARASSRAAAGPRPGRGLELSRLSSARISSSASGCRRRRRGRRRATRLGHRVARPAWRSSSGARGRGGRARASRCPARRRARALAAPPTPSAPSRGGEAQRLERRLVEPLEVVDHAQHRPLLGGEREQPEQRGADRQARRGSAGASWSAPSSAAAWRRAAGRQRRHRLAQFGQPGDGSSASPSSPRVRSRSCRGASTAACRSASCRSLARRAARARRRRLARRSPARARRARAPPRVRSAPTGESPRAPRDRRWG